MMPFSHWGSRSRLPVSLQIDDVRGTLRRRSPGGRYRLGAELGRGGSAVVYRAHDTLLGRDLVVVRPGLSRGRSQG